MISGSMAFLARLISKSFIIFGSKFSIFAYLSIGDIVPDVRITFLNF